MNPTQYSEALGQTQSGKAQLLEAKDPARLVMRWLKQKYPKLRVSEPERRLRIGGSYTQYRFGGSPFAELFTIQPALLNGEETGELLVMINSFSIKSEDPAVQRVPHHAPGTLKSMLVLPKEGRKAVLDHFAEYFEWVLPRLRPNGGEGTVNSILVRSLSAAKMQLLTDKVPAAFVRRTHDELEAS